MCEVFDSNLRLRFKIGLPSKIPLFWPLPFSNTIPIADDRVEAVTLILANLLLISNEGKHSKNPLHLVE